MGGLVTSHGAGMSVPDWPNSYGYNMFLFPPRLWVGGILYEHTHRLAGVVVGMLSILLAAIAWRTEPRRWVRWLCAGVLGAVIVQGVIGGLRVVLVELDLAVVHACFAQAFFCLAALLAVVTSRWWHDADVNRQPSATAGQGLALFAAIAFVMIYVQLVAGALMRHYGAGLAIPDLPLAYGKFLPPVSKEGMRAANELRVWEAGLGRVTLAQVWLHFAHRVGAVVVSIVVIAASVRVLRRRRAGLTGPAALMLVLLAVQVTLGVVTVLYRKPADVASAHVAVGALLLVTTFILTVRAMRLYRPAARATQAAESAGFALPAGDLATV